MSLTYLGRDKEGRRVEAEIRSGRIHIVIDEISAFDIYCASSEAGIVVRGVAGSGGDYDAITVAPRASNAVVISGGS